MEAVFFMNFSLIAFLLGRLSLALSAILLLPVGLAIFYEDGSFVEFAITSFTASFVSGAESSSDSSKSLSP